MPLPAIKAYRQHLATAANLNDATHRYRGYAIDIRQPLQLASELTSLQHRNGLRRIAGLPGTQDE